MTRQEQQKWIWKFISLLIERNEQVATLGAPGLRNDYLKGYLATVLENLKLDAYEMQEIKNNVGYLESMIEGFKSAKGCQ
jgi:hypothetical protein